MAEQIAHRENTRSVHSGSDSEDGAPFNLGAAIGAVLARAANAE